MTDLLTRLEKNFILREFIISDFYSTDMQDRVLEAFRLEEDEILPRIKKLAKNLQVLREYLDSPININIAYRPLFWELKQKRSGKSQHVKGWAADIVSDDYSPKEVYDAISNLIAIGKMDEGGLGSYSNFTHVDTRGIKARW